MLKGTIASKGSALGQAFKLVKPTLDIKHTTCDDPQACLKALNDALEKSTRDLKMIRDKTLESLDEEHADIFDAHIQMIDDPEIKSQVTAMIEDGKSAEHAYQTVTNQFIDIFENMDDDYFKGRAADIKDIQYRVLSYLLDQPIKDMATIEEDTIIFAHDLTPSDTANLDFSVIKGFVTEVGGMTSHSAIMARAFNIPAIVGVKKALEAVEDGDTIYLNAHDNAITINPNAETIDQAKAQIKADQARLETLKKYKNKTTQSKDGQSLPIYANIGSHKEVQAISDNGAEGVGLFRTEFLFMDSEQTPTLDEQINAYETVFKSVQPVIVRTLDIGGDKELPYLKQEKEDNPFLGKRAIRLCFDEIDLFKTQLKALLKAAVDQPDVRIMFPMIATRDELRKAKSIVDDVAQDLKNKQEAYQTNIKIGIMIEIPSAALNAATLAKEVDFFSIGTNDLIQYLFAADRMNETVSYLYEPFDPTLLRLIQQTITAAHAQDTEIGVCGEMASDLDAALLLYGMGIDELSMSPSSILDIRKTIANVNFNDLKQLAKKALNQEDAHAVKSVIKAFKDQHLSDE